MDNKKIISLLLAGTMAASSSAAIVSSAEESAFAPAQVQAQAEMNEVGKVKYNSKFAYRINDDGKTLTLVDFTEKAVSNGTLKIPSKIGGKKVTGIGREMGNYAWSIWYSKKIKRVEIPKTVKTIENGFDARYGYTTDYVANYTIVCYKNTEGEKFAARSGLKYTLKDGNKNHVCATRIKKGAAVGAGAVKFKWEKVSNATGYRVLRYDWDKQKWIKLKDVKASQLSYKDTTCNKKTLNFYSVRAFRKVGSKTYWSELSAAKGLSCMKTSAPKVSVENYSTADGAEFPVKVTPVSNNYDNYDVGFSIEVLDPYTKKWCSVYDLYNVSYEGDYITFSGYYKQIGDNTYWECVDKGQTYKVRVANVERVYDVVSLTKGENSSDMFIYTQHYIKGKTVTKSVKVK